MKKIISSVFPGTVVTPRQELKWMLERAGVTIEQVEEIKAMQKLIEQQTINLAIQKYRKQDNKEEMNILSIDIYYSETNDGYCYDIYDTISQNEKEANDSLDGGMCTGRLIDALGMATKQASEIIKRVNI